MLPNLGSGVPTFTVYIIFNVIVHNMAQESFAEKEGNEVLRNDLNVFVAHAGELDRHSEQLVFVFMKGSREGVLVHENKIGTGVAAHARKIWKLLLYDGDEILERIQILFAQAHTNIESLSNSASRWLNRVNPRFLHNELLLGFGLFVGISHFDIRTICFRHGVRGPINLAVVPFYEIGVAGVVNLLPRLGVVVPAFQSYPVKMAHLRLEDFERLRDRSYRCHLFLLICTIPVSITFAYDNPRSGSLFFTGC